MFVGDIGSVVWGALDGKIFVHRLARNSAHDVDAEFKTFAVDVIRERLETGTIRR